MCVHMQIIIAVSFLKASVTHVFCLQGMSGQVEPHTMGQVEPLSTMQEELF